MLFCRMKGGYGDALHAQASSVQGKNTVIRSCAGRGRRKVKQMMYKMWAKVYEANYHKSLDHRSFYFKQVRRATRAPALCAALGRRSK